MQPKGHQLKSFVLYYSYLSDVYLLFIQMTYLPSMSVPCWRFKYIPFTHTSDLPAESTACDVKLALNGHFVLIIVDNSQWLLYLKSDLIIHYMSGYIKSTSHYYIPVHNSSVITKIIFLRELLSFYSPITLRGTDLSWCVPHCSPENSQQGSQF